MKRDILSVLDLQNDMDDILELSSKLRKDKFGINLKNRSMAMIFEKSSTRTRVSFEMAMIQEGGHAIYLSQKDSQLGRGETIPDTARVLSRFVDCIVYRAFSHENMLDLAKYATIPVINALDDVEHPCQIVADILTIKENKGHLKGLKIAYIGDGNNVCNSLMLGSAIAKMDFVAGCPEGYRPNRGLEARARKIAKENNCSFDIVSDPMDAAEGADVVYTDTWVSMGQEAEAEQKEKLFRPYQINERLIEKADPKVIFMHCLPAHRGVEVTDGIMDGVHSVVFDEAENRLHAQKAILVTIMSSA